MVLIYLDNAATSLPKPEQVWRAMECALSTLGNPGRGGHEAARAAEAAVAAVRSKAARFFNAPASERVIFTLNATDALNLALKGYLSPGDHVVTTPFEHNSVVRPLASLGRTLGVTSTEARADEEGVLDPAALEAVIRPQTRLAVVSWVSNVTGAVQPVAALAEVCRRHGVALLADASQAAGHVPIDVQAAGIDLLACSGHKGLLGPTGVGLLVLSEALDLRPQREGGTGIASQNPDQPEDYPYRLEAGTPNTIGIAGLGAGLDFLSEVGLPEVNGKEETLITGLWDGLAAIRGVTLYGPRQASRRAGVVSFNLDGWDPVDVATVLDQAYHVCCRAGLHCSPRAHRSLGTLPAGTVRFGVGYFNTPAEVETAVRAVAALARA